MTTYPIRYASIRFTKCQHVLNELALLSLAIMEQTFNSFCFVCFFVAWTFKLVYTDWLRCMHWSKKVKLTLVLPIWISYLHADSCKRCKRELFASSDTPVLSNDRDRKKKSRGDWPCINYKKIQTHTSLFSIYKQSGCSLQLTAVYSEDLPGNFPDPSPTFLW